MVSVNISTYYIPINVIYPEKIHTKYEIKCLKVHPSQGRNFRKRGITIDEKKHGMVNYIVIEYF